MAKLTRVLHNSSLYLVGNLASRAVGFLAIPIYSRLLTPAQFGIIELIELSIEIVALTFGLQSIGTALTRTYHEQQTPERAKTVVSTGLMFSAGLSSVVAICAIAFASPLSRAVFHSANESGLLRAAFAAMFFANLVEVTLTYARIQDQALFFLRYALVTLAVSFGLNILFIGFLDAGVWGFVLTKLAVTIGGSVFLLLRTARSVGWRFDRSLIPGFVRFGAPLAVSGLAFFLIHFSDRFFLTANVSLADLGKYGLAYRFAFLVSILIGDSFGKSWNATFYRFAGQDGWRQQFAQVASYLVFVLCTVGLGIALFGPEVLHLMVPPDFYPPALVLPLLVFAYVFREIGDFFNNLLLINKRSGLIGRIAVGGAVMNALLNWALIAPLGIEGAATATLLTWVIYMVVCWIIAHREHRVPVRVDRFFLIIGLAGSIFAASEALRVTGFWVQSLADGAWSLLFIGLCLLLYFSAEDRRNLGGIAKGAIRTAWHFVRTTQPAQ